jgi:hypothetical protein
MTQDYSTATFDSSKENYTSGIAGISIRKVKRYIRRSVYLPFIIVFFFAIILISLFIKVFNNSSSRSPVALANDPRLTVEQPKAKETLHKMLNIPIKDQSGKQINQLHYYVIDAQKEDQILIKGEKATAVQGRTFLTLNIKITNPYEKTVQLNTKDFLRLLVNGSDEKLAPEIHSDPVDVQAQSTKYTRLGFPINDTDKNLILQIGEISGTKEFIKLDLK